MQSLASCPILDEQWVLVQQRWALLGFMVQGCLLEGVEKEVDVATMSAVQGHF
jgi:hypothetical protein